ncbi:MAG: hypothetical protein M0C28_37460 [Candidatus Moduliflexus flocculans]|nr:hypothetical protein [Candidatus Moduliflexus flocculans]
MNFFQAAAMDAVRPWAFLPRSAHDALMRREASAPRSPGPSRQEATKAFGAGLPASPNRSSSSPEKMDIFDDPGGRQA